MIRIVEDMRDVNIYLSLRKQVGWIKLDENQAQRALDNSVKVFTVYDDGKPIEASSSYCYVCLPSEPLQYELEAS